MAEPNKSGSVEKYGAEYPMSTLQMFGEFYLKVALVWPERKLAVEGVSGGLVF